jgi:hypothetical protein
MVNIIPTKMIIIPSDIFHTPGETTWWKGMGSPVWRKCDGFLYGIMGYIYICKWGVIPKNTIVIGIFIAYDIHGI